MGETERGQAGRGVGLRAEGVAGLGGRGAVIAPAVGLNNEAQVRPEEVDLELVDHVFGQRGRQPRGGSERTKEPFQLVVRKAEGVLVEDVTEEAYARLARVLLKFPAQRVGVDHPELVRLVDRALQRLRPRNGGKVEEGANGRGHWYVEMRPDIAIPEPRAGMR